MTIVMLLTNDFSPDVRVYKEARYLIEQGHQVAILCWDRNRNSVLPKEEEKDGIRIIRFRFPSVAGSGYRQAGAYLKYIKACSGYLASHPADYVHCHDLDGVLAYKIGRNKKIPYVFDMHEFYIRGSGGKKHFLRYLVGKLIEKSYYSLYENSGYLNIYPTKITERLLPLRNYPDTYLERWDKTNSDKLRIGYHGCVRGQIPEFTALFEACKGMENVRVDIHGGGVDLPELKELEKKYSNVSIHGPYDGIKESSGLYQNTDILFCGYNPDNPNYQGDAEVVKFYEAIVTGTPMLITAGIGMADKVRKNGFGIAVDTRDADAIKKAIEQVLKHRNVLREYSRNMQKAASNYQWKEEVTVLRKVYGSKARRKNSGIPERNRAKKQ